MATDLKTVAEEIGKRHGIKISKDDPVMILVTANNMLIEELYQQIQNMLAQIASENEVAITRYQQSIKDISSGMLKEAAAQSQSIINKTLTDSKAALQTTIAQAVQMETDNIKAQLEPPIERAKQAAYISFVAACAAILAAGIALWTAL